MVWNQYLEDVHNNKNDYSSDEENEIDPPRNRPLEFQDWITWYSDDLMNLWLSMKTYRQDTGNVDYLLNKMDWNIFCEFCYEYSSKLAN